MDKRFLGRIETPGRTYPLQLLVNKACHSNKAGIIGYQHTLLRTNMGKLCFEETRRVVLTYLILNTYSISNLHLHINLFCRDLIQFIRIGMAQACYKNRNPVFLVLISLLISSFSFGQLNGGAIERSKCVAINGTATFTSLRAPTTGATISWEQDDNAGFSHPTTIIGANSSGYTTPSLGVTTYYRRKVSSGGSTAYSNVVTVTVGTVTSPVFTPTAISSICQGDASFTVSFSTTGSPTKYSIIWDDTPSGLGFVDVTNQNLTASPLVVNVPTSAPNGSYSGTLIAVDANGCSTSGGNASFTFNPLPTVSITAPSAICSPGTIDITSIAVTSGSSPTTGMNYTRWNNAAATSSLTNAAAITVTGVYYIKGTISATGCAVTKPVTATINPLPTVVITTPAAACTPGTIDLTNVSITSAGSTANLSYTQWNNAAATSSLANANTVTATGVYYIKGTIAATGCAVTKSVTATINTSPTVTVSPPAAICSPGTIDLTSASITSAGSTANLSYTQWNNAAATSSLTNANAITATGVYYIKGTIAATGCSATQPVTATINPLPTLVITAPSVCSPGTIDLTSASVTSAGSTANLSYTQWNNAAATSTLANANAITATGVYYIKGTVAATGCAVTKPVTATVNPLPTVVITTPSAICAPGTIDLTNASITSAGSTANLSYTQWNNVTATSSLTNANAITATGVYYIKGTIPTTGCGVVKPVTVTVNPLPTLVITAPAAICSPGSIDLTSASLTSAGSTANLSYTQWTNAAATSTLANANAITATGVYYIKGTIAATGCAAVKPVTVTVNTSPTVVITNPPAVCAPLTVDLTASSIKTGSTAGLTYTYWSNAANTNPLPTPSAVNATGVYYIKGTIAATGCGSSQPVTVTVNPQPNGTLQNPLVNYICNGSSLVLNASNAFAYQWYRDGQPVSGAVADNYAAIVAGDYTVRFISKDGCSKDAGNTITLSLLTKPVLQYKLSSTCAGSPISFTNGSVITSSGNINWQWDFGDGGVSTITSPVYTYANGGSYNITLTANNTSCSTLTEKTVLPFTIESPRIPTRYADVNAVGGVPIQLNSRNAGNVYLWQPSTGLNNAAMQFPTATLDKDVEYTITINSNAGCTVTDTVLVKVALDGFIYVGQGFTPNGDGMNDRCYPITTGIRSLTYFKIFNRWGNLVFQTNDATPQNGWDGKYNGKIQPAGTYQWVAEAVDGGGNIIKRTGSVLLIN